MFLCLCKSIALNCKNSYSDVMITIVCANCTSQNSTDKHPDSILLAAWSQVYFSPLYHPDC